MIFTQIDFDKVGQHGCAVKNPSAEARHFGINRFMDHEDVMFSFILVPAFDSEGNELTKLPKVAWVYGVESALLEKVPKEQTEGYGFVLAATGMCLLNFVYLNILDRENGEKLARQILDALLPHDPNNDLCESILDIHESLLEGYAARASVGNVFPIR